MLSCSWADLSSPQHGTASFANPDTRTDHPPTCNRLELYAVIDHAVSGWQTMLATLLEKCAACHRPTLQTFIHTHRP
ncbi:MAG: hypothetical protein R3E31_01835 [Chloroflexota bacterium]